MVIRTYDNKVYKNFHCLNVPEDGVEYQSFTIFFVDYSLAYEKNILSASTFTQLCL